MFPQSVLRKIVSALPGYTTDGGTAELLDTAGDIATIDVRHMVNVEIYVSQVTDAGTCTIDIERSLDGTNWDPVGQFTEASFPAGDATAQSLLLVDSNGMPLLAKYVRVKLTAVAGGGEYNARAYGMELNLNERLIIDSGTYGPDADTDGLLEAATDAVTFSTKGLTNIEVMLNQITDPGAGTCAIDVYRSCDNGATWDLLASKADTDFAAANNTSTPVSLSGTGGRPLHADQVKVVLSAVSAGGAWTAHVVGIQTPGVR